MPTTINGIGTRYYGSRNVQVRPGTCPYCGQWVQLSSYDTRLWFVVVFIPVIPLGRKRIIDSCPACRRHRVMDLDQWETSKQLEISGAEEELRKSPTPENAMAVHRQMFRFHQLKEAAGFRDQATRQFPESAALQAHFGETLQQHGRAAEAAPYFARALELRPDLPAARAGVADAYIAAGRLDEAAVLLDFLRKPGASQLYSLSALERLARAYQKGGDHERALEILQYLLSELPAVASNSGFRDLVKTSEKALGRASSILPPLTMKARWKNLLAWRSGAPHRRMSKRTGWIIIGCIVGLAVLIPVVMVEYGRHHNTVFLVNGYPEPVTFEIAGTEVRQAVKHRAKIELSEGTYHAIVTGAVTQEFDFTVKAGYGERFGQHPVWMLNAGGDAILILQAVTYAQHPPPATFTIHFGAPVEYFANLTNPFEALPPSIQLHSGESRTLTNLESYSGGGSALIGYFLTHKDPARALAVGESWLRTHPDDNDVIETYLGVARDQQADARAEAFLSSGLAARPVRIGWHRAYQVLHGTPADQPKLLAIYTDLSRKSPADSGLLYLRGRLDPDSAKQQDYFRRALERDAKNPYALYGLAYVLMAQADWAGAKPLLQRALAVRPKDATYANGLFVARLALGESAALARECADLVRREPHNAVAAYRLVEALAVDQRRGEAEAAVAAFARSNSGDEDDRRWANGLQQYERYALGDLAAIEQSSSRMNPDDRRFRAEVMIETARPAEAAALLSEKGARATLEESLALAVAWKQAGRNDEVRRALEQAHETLVAGGGEYAQAAAWVAKSELPSVEAVQQLLLPPREKATLVWALAAQRPETSANYAPLIKALNVEPEFPYHFIRRTIAMK